MEAGAAVAVEPTQVQAPKRRARRRRWQSGSIYRRGSGFTIVYRTPEGKQKWESGFENKGKAQDRLTEALGQIKDNKFVDPQDMLFKDWCDTWLESKKGKLKPSTWGSYNSAIHRWLLPHFQDWFLADINRRAIVEFFDALAGKKSRYGSRRLSHQFIRNVHIVLRKLFNDAIDRDLAASNPAHRLKLGGFGRDAEARPVPSANDVVKTFAKLSPSYQSFLVLGAVTGLRRGELLGLRWQDIDVEGGVLNVNWQLQRVKKALLNAGTFQNLERIGKTGLVLMKPKSKTSIRAIEVGRDLVKIIRQHHDLKPAATFVFEDEFGNPFDPKSIYEPLYAAQDAAKVKRFPPHGLRHLYTSLLHKSGATVKHAQERLGHSSPLITLGIYTHVIDDEGRKFAEKVEANFSFVSQLLATENSPQETVQ